MAILLVLACHSLPHTEGGGIGVNVFFVLSGFLITGLLLTEYDRTHRVWMGGFYARRLLRLMPALLVMLAVVAVLPNVYGGAIDGSSISRLASIPAALFYVGNYVQAFGHPLGYLSHTWSLAVEEQFYLLWPVSFVWLLRRGKLRSGLPLLIAGFVVTRALLAAFGSPRISSGLSAWLPSQADGLLLGALVAVLLLEGHLDWAGRSLFGWTSLATIVALVLIGTATKAGVEGKFGLYGGITVSAMATGIFIAHLCSDRAGALRSLFSCRPAVWLGRVSYGVYLYHFPVFQWIQHQRWSLPKTLFVEYGITAALVIVSWLLVEQPLLRLKDRFREAPRSDRLESRAPAAALS